MLRKIILSSLFLGLTIPSAFAQQLANITTANVSTDREQSIIIYKLLSLAIQSPVAQAGAASATVHEIRGEASITPARCMRGGCVGMPKPETAAFIFKSPVTDRNPSSELLFFSCRRAIETSRAGDTIILTGDIQAKPVTDFPGIQASRVFEFTNLKDCEVMKDDGPISLSN